MSVVEPTRTGETGPLTVVNNEAAHRFEIQTAEGLAELRYRVRGGTILLLHTGVPPALENHGIASLLARTALEYAREHGLSVDVRCPFVAGFVERHSEFKDLVLPKASLPHPSSR